MDVLEAALMQNPTLYYKNQVIIQQQKIAELERQLVESRGIIQKWIDYVHFLEYQLCESNSIINQWVDYTNYLNDYLINIYNNTKTKMQKLVPPGMF